MSPHLDQIRSDYDRFAQLWNANDGDKLAEFFVDDGVLINPLGQRADGRDAVRSMYNEFFGGMLRGTTTTISLGSVRDVEGSHAIVDGSQVIYTPDGSVLMDLHVTALMRRTGGGWRFVDARPYTFATVPA